MKLTKVTSPAAPYLANSDIIDWHHPHVQSLAQQLHKEAIGAIATPVDELTESWPQDWVIANACFTWVRDRVAHSVDARRNPVTCCASEVLQHHIGYCFGKSHLLAALLRASRIPAGFCYQRLSLNDQGAPYGLHGFNGVYLSTLGWYRVDTRGDRSDTAPIIKTGFTPPQEQLAYPIQLPEEANFPAIFPEPLPIVVTALQRYEHWEELLEHLPDISPSKVHSLGCYQSPPSL